MSGDVQPRKRKDKKKKREDDEIKEQHQGVHNTKMGEDDIHLHVHSDHGTGGHWCAKIFFFALLAILIGLTGIIILENQDQDDVDTPLSESRFSNYFEGWVDEHRVDDHAHDPVIESIEDHDDEHDEPFDEEEDHSELEDSHNDHEDENDEGAEDEEDEEITEEATEEQPTEEDDEDDEALTQEQSLEGDGEEGNDEEGGTKEDDEDDGGTKEDDDGDNEGNNEDEDNEDEDVFNEDDEDNDDENEESNPKVVDNDAEELELLKEKARQQEEDDDGDDGDKDKYSASSKVRGGGPQNVNDKEDDDVFEKEFRHAEEYFHKQKYQEALEIFERLTIHNPDRPQSFHGKARSLDALAELHQSNYYLKEAIKEYKRFLAFKEELEDQEFLSATQRCVERMQFLGHYLDAANIQKNLIERFPNVSDYRNQLAISYLSVNRLPEAKRVLHETLLKWRHDGVALVHYGFVCKALDNNCTNAVTYLREGLETEEEGTQDARFYFNLGDCLQRLGRLEEARNIFKKGAEKKMFLSEYQRSLYNVDNLKAQPFWTKDETTYPKSFAELEKNWEKIKEEGLRALNSDNLFQNETENLKDKGDWKQFDLFMRGLKIKENCAQAPITCGIIESFPEARLCKRGQVKFSVMLPGTHVWPHCGPTNCRLRAHLGLVVPKGTGIRVGEEERTWEEGKFLIFDDSFEHEVWHNGSSFRLVLIVDIWHPDLTKEQKFALSPI